MIRARFFSHRQKYDQIELLFRLTHLISLVISDVVNNFTLMKLSGQSCSSWKAHNKMLHTIMGTAGLGRAPFKFTDESLFRKLVRNYSMWWMKKVNSVIVCSISQHTLSMLESQESSSCIVYHSLWLTTYWQNLWVEQFNWNCSRYLVQIKLFFFRFSSAVTLDQ